VNVRRFPNVVVERVDEEDAATGCDVAAGEDDDSDGAAGEDAAIAALYTAMLAGVLAVGKASGGGAPVA